MPLFAVTEESVHHVGDARCPACAEDYPEPCRCGGLMHGEQTEVEDAEIVEATRCDQCGRTLDDLAERL
ncbi:MAG TPA: hypothetical protein VNN07_14430 [Candidatus Tectomicrobia bacterium]|nr:hypothetical protein [Candidatus Tectomicrobia bacterium]